jgi:malonyl CoA-acyl carrier protein transacylase
MTTYVFPGQGSQSRGMGGSLFSEFPDIITQANRILGYSIVDLCLQNPSEQLNQTQYTQPAIYVVNALQYMKKATKNHKPDYVAGHSLGEYNALLAANVIDFESGLRLVQKRGELMSKATGGGMAAIIGIKGTEVETIIEQQGLTDVSIANYNSYTQTVISGPRNAVYATQQLFEQAGASLFIPLQVSGAFHSAHMGAATQQFAHFLDNFKFNAPSIPVIANINAKPYQPDTIKSLLIQQTTHPVQWTKTVEYLLAQGECDFYEIGPGMVLSGLINRIRKGE